MTTSVDLSALRLGTAPDSWGVWFPDDPGQVPWSRYLDEVQRAGYRWTELGPYGYLPTDPARLGDELAQRDLSLTGGTVIAALQHGSAALEEAKRACDDEAATLVPLGARHVVFLPEGYTDLDGRRTGSLDLTAAEWDALTSGVSALGAYVRDEHGLELVFHSHADSHIATQGQIDRLLESTDPTAVNLCLDTGHVAYCGGDNLDLIERFPVRIRYVHLKQVDPAILRRAIDEALGFAPAVRLEVMVEPPLGEPAMPPILAALASLDRELFCIVEQDMIGCALDRPYPIARRTREYLAGCGLGSGRPRPAGRAATDG